MIKRILILFIFSLNIIAIPSIYQEGNVQFEFIDSIDTYDIDETDDISVIIELNYVPLNCELKMTDDIISNREAKDKLIENNENYYYHNNLHVIDNLDLDTAGNFIISSSGGSLLGIGTGYKICLLCGGSAEIGFVQLNAASTEKGRYKSYSFSLCKM